MTHCLRSKFKPVVGISGRVIRILGLLISMVLDIRTLGKLQSVQPILFERMSLSLCLAKRIAFTNTIIYGHLCFLLITGRTNGHATRRRKY